MITEKDINEAIKSGNKTRERIRLESTKTPSGHFNDYDARFDMFNSILDTYQMYNVSGGSLHIYLEDGNKGIDSIEFCKNYAKEHGDWIGVYLCEELLYFGEKFINTLIDDDILIAIAEWKGDRLND